MKKISPQVPGRGLMNQTAFDLRMDYLDQLQQGIIKDVKSDTIQLSQVQNNIESYIGTTEIPLGLVGPILFNAKGKTPEWVHTAVATTEGALVASMNRGAKAISECGGFTAHIVHQKMLRTPMFTFKSMTESLDFCEWIRTHFDAIKKVTHKHSNYAELLEISSVVIGKIVHLKFIYSTSDASGQNMTTSCTWNACLWIENHFETETQIEILHFVIDGNGASDKKVSYYSMLNGRGTHVIGECFLSNGIIEKTLRTNATDMFRSFNHSMAISRLDGMIGYNINVANTIAGIYAATGQDLACIHESSTGVLQMEQTTEGLYLSLILPNLVIGTVGGGTHFPVPSRILDLMGCKGAGKMERFAQLILGYALALEVSTLAAIVSGQFARAHQKLGRNKPVKWLLKSELDAAFVEDNMRHLSAKISSVQFDQIETIENGIITQLTNRVSKKVLGFTRANVLDEKGNTIPILLKSKALGKEVLDGLYFMASNVNVDLADTLLRFQNELEYGQSHLIEIDVYDYLQEQNYPFIPKFYGAKVDKKREIYVLLIEALDPKELSIFNAEDKPEVWEVKQIKSVISAIHKVHAAYNKQTQHIESIQKFDIGKPLELYRTFVAINRKDYDYWNLDYRFEQMNDFMHLIGTKERTTYGKSTLIHNDFNPRNAGIRANGTPVIYDWELANYGLPQRDIFEFLAFALQADFEESLLSEILDFHYILTQEINGAAYNWEHYLSDLKLAGEDFLISRVNFYLAGSTLVNYPFIKRVFKNSFLMLDWIVKQK